MIFKVISISFILILNIYAFDDEIQFSHLTAEDGLSLNAVTKIIQDSRGYLWFGTFNGLNRYDGYNFKTFLPDVTNPISISNHAIWALYEDSGGSIWIGTLNGLNRYDWKTEKFYKYKNDPKDPHSISHNHVLSIYEDKSGTLWVGTQNGLNKFNRNENNFTVIKKVSSKLNPDSLNSVLCIEGDSKGNLWLGTWNGLTCMQKNGNSSYYTLTGNKNPNALIYNGIKTIKKDDDGNLWIGTYGDGLYRYDQKNGNFSNYTYNPKNPNSISDNSVNVIYEDRLKNLWLGTKNGLNKFDKKKNLFIRSFHDESNQYSISDNEILSIGEDKTGIIWVGTLNGGLNSFMQSLNKFRYFKDNPNVVTKLESSRINSVYLDKSNNIWVGTKGGLKEIKLNGDRLNGNEQIIEFVHDSQNNNSLSDSYVRTVLEDHLGLIWIGTDVGGLNCYNPKTKEFRNFRFIEGDESSISNNGIVSLYEDHKGNLWIGTWWGLNLFDRRNEKFIRFVDKTKSNTIWVINEDSKGIIWCGTDGSGLKLLNPVTRTCSYYVRDSVSKINFTGNRVFSIYKSRDGVMWFGTTEGLNSYNSQTGKFKAYNKADGLPSITINDIIEDDKGYLWVSSDKGLSRFDRKTGEFKNFTKRNGIKELEFSPNTSAKLKDGTLIFGSRKGLMYFHPDSIIDEYQDVPVVFTDLRIFNESVPISSNGILKESIQNSKIISIPHSNDMITLEFALLDYYDAKKNCFQYKLTGFDADWINVGTRNTATYTNLPPGQYTFCVRASNENGIKNIKEASLKIIIIPAYYQTWWFKVLLTFFIVCVFIVTFQARTKVMKRQNRILENRVAQRTMDLDKTIKELNMEIASKDKFFSIIAHDLRSPFTGLLGLLRYLSEDAEEITKDELKVISESMLQSAEITFDLLENLLNWARIKTGRINFEPQMINIKLVIEEIVGLFKDYAGNKDICLKNEIKGDYFVYADLNMVKTVLRNLISNSIKFTPKGGEVNIRISDGDKQIGIYVNDTGVGISREIIDKLFQIDENVSTSGTENEKGSGLGLILCKEFIALNKGEIFVKSEIGKGSEFCFTLPKI